MASKNFLKDYQSNNNSQCKYCSQNDEHSAAKKLITTGLHTVLHFTQFLPFQIILICVCFFWFCRSRKVDCVTFIRLTLLDDGQSLDVIEMNENHSNHTISRELFSHLPKQRRLDQEDLQHAKTLISVQANSKLIQQHLQNTTGRVVLLKDIANIANKLRKQSKPNNLTEVVKKLQRCRDCVVQVLATEDNIFCGLLSG